MTTPALGTPAFLQLANDLAPAIVTRVNADGSVNVTAFPDGVATPVTMSGLTALPYVDPAHAAPYVALAATAAPVAVAGVAHRGPGGFKPTAPAPAPAPSRFGPPWRVAAPAPAAPAQGSPASPTPPVVHGK